MTLFAGVDLGTGGARCLVVDERGRRVALGRRAWTYRRDGAAVTLDRQVALDAIAAATGEALAACDGDDIAAIGVTSQRHGCALVGDGDLEIEIIANVDPRAAAEAFAMERAHGPLIYGITGRLSPATLFLPPRLAWFRANQPEVLTRVRRALQLSDWLVWHLCGVSATEPMQAAETLVYDLAAGTWSDTLLDALDVPRAILPAIIGSGTPAGEVQGGAAARFGFPEGVPVVAAGGDTQCAALGAGARSPGDETVVTGTTMFCDRIVAGPTADPGGRLWTSPFAVPGLFVREAHAFEAGSALAWFGGIVGDEPGDLARAAEHAPPGAGGVRFIDSFPGESTDFPLLRRGGWSLPLPVLHFGWDRAVLARAVLEGIAFGARAGLEWLDTAAGSPAPLFATGGLTRSRVFVEALAGAAGAAVRVATEPYTSALGAAIVAASAHFGGVDAAARAMADAGRKVAPRESDGYAAHYAEWREQAAEMIASAVRVSDL